MGTVKVTNIEPIADNGTVTLGGSGDTITLGSGATVTGTGLVGITMADSWRLTANTNQGTNAVVATNWERNDTNSFSQIGTGLTESSGVFSFAQTGIYLIINQFEFITDSSEVAAFVFTQTTLDNSTYSDTTLIRSGDVGTGDGLTLSNNFIFDVTNISNCKFRFKTDNFATNTKLVGGTTYQRSGFSIIRLGDSV